MGRPPTTVHLCHELQRLLLDSGFAPGMEIPRDRWDQIVARLAQVGSPQARNITKTGLDHGLWDVAPRQHNGTTYVPGWVALRPAAETSQHLGQEGRVVAQ